MRNRYIALLTLIILLLTLCLSHTYTLNASAHDTDTIELSQSDVNTYIIQKTYDLRGDTLFLPLGGALLFKHMGRIKNGVIIGNNTEIKSYRRRHVFENVKFGGSFTGSVQSQWFPLLYGIKVDNSNELNCALELASLSSFKYLSLNKRKTLYLKSDIPSQETRDFLRHGTVEIKSGVCFDLNGSTLKCLPNNAKAYNIIFSRNTENITICNGVICGDSRKHKGNKGEWGYGIELQGVHGFVLENLECKYCWGDGINIQVAFDGDGDPYSTLTKQGHCSDGIINNVDCHHNRRQGMSIEGIIGLRVSNSTFSYTDGANPRSGIDIEPYSDNNLVRDVLITECAFFNNAYSGVLMMGNNVSAVTIDNCRFNNNMHFDFTLKGNNITISNCKSTPISVRLVDECTGVKVKDSIIDMFQTENFTKSSFSKDIEFDNCYLLYKQINHDKFLNVACQTTYTNCTYR